MCCGHEESSSRKEIVSTDIQWFVISFTLSGLISDDMTCKVDDKREHLNMNGQSSMYFFFSEESVVLIKSDQESKIVVQ